VESAEKRSVKNLAQSTRVFTAAKFDFAGANQSRPNSQADARFATNAIVPLSRSRHAWWAGASPVTLIIYAFFSLVPLGRKVSDEYTVPLCRIHHRQLHQTGNEVAWWDRLKISPAEGGKATLAKRPIRCRDCSLSESV